MQLRAFAAKEFNDSQANRIRAAWGAGSENAVRTIVDGRSAEQFESLGAVELPEDDEVREAFDVSETELKLGLDVENALGLMFYAETFGDFAGGFVGTAYRANLLRGEHEYLFERRRSGATSHFIRKRIAARLKAAPFQKRSQLKAWSIVASRGPGLCPADSRGRLSPHEQPGFDHALAMRRIRSSCCCLLSAPMVKASRMPSDSAYLIASS